MTRLAMVMIARDEARCIARALESVRPHVDRMIVLDTGSTDDTAAIALACGAEVGHFAWTGDFSAARNAALSLSDARWNLVLDADEELDGDASALSRAALPQDGEDFLGLVQVMSEIDAGGEASRSVSWIARLLPRGAAYEGRVHEQPVAAGPARRLPLRLLHDGYLPQNLARKAGRNEALLRLELAETPGDAYLQYQLGRELHGAPRFEHRLAVAIELALADAAGLGEGRPGWPGGRGGDLGQGGVVEDDVGRHVLPAWASSLLGARRAGPRTGPGPLGGDGQGLALAGSACAAPERGLAASSRCWRRMTGARRDRPARTPSTSPRPISGRPSLGSSRSRPSNTRVSKRSRQVGWG
jgi:hypothetical protein